MVDILILVKFYLVIVGLVYVGINLYLNYFILVFFVIKVIRIIDFGG